MSTDWSLSASDAATLRKIALAAERATLLGRYVGPYDRVMVPFPQGDHEPGDHEDFIIPAGGFRDYATSGPSIGVMKWLVSHDKVSKNDEFCISDEEFCIQKRGILYQK